MTKLLEDGSASTDRSSDRLTTREYWDGGYGGNANVSPLTIAGFRNRPARRIIETIESVGLSGKRILEVGAGNSEILCYLSRRYSQSATFGGLDYSEQGCALLAKRARDEGVAIDIYCNDLFAPPTLMEGGFDVVYSLGVVEHFADLAGVLIAKKRLLSEKGHMVTIIPNMAGVIGQLTRRYAPAVYRKHNPHDLDSFRQGHDDAGLSLEASGYLCSTNFGVLSACFPSRSTAGWGTFVWLTRLSKILWLVENNGRDLFQSRYLSPYFFAVATKRS